MSLEEEFSDNEASEQIAILEQEIESSKKAQERARKRGSDWYSVQKQFNQDVARKNQQIERIKEGNKIQKKLARTEYDILISNMEELKKFHEEIISKERNLSKNDLWILNMKIHEVKLCALRTLRVMEPYYQEL